MNSHQRFKQALDKFSARLPPYKMRLPFLLLVLVVILDCLNHGRFSDNVWVRNFPPWVTAALLRTVRDITFSIGLATVVGLAALFAFPALQKPHRAFLLCACLLGPIYAFLITPFSPPDENRHYQPVLACAASFLGMDSLDRSYLMETIPEHRNSTTGYVLERRIFKRDAPMGRTFRISDLPKRNNVFEHLPPILGNVIGLKLGLAPMANFYLGRFFALVFYILLVTLAIRLSPVLKECIAVVALCPMSLQQACSYSYDSETFVCSFLCLALILKFALEGQKPPSKILFGVLCATLVLGMAIKCSVIAFIPLLFAIPESRFATGKRGKVLFRAITCTLAACAAASSIFTISPGTMEGGSAAWSLMFLAKHPMRLAHILLNTFDHDWLEIPFCSLGWFLSGRSLRLPALYIMVLQVLFVLAIRRERQALPRPLRMAAAIGVFLQTAYVMVPMLTTYTPFGRIAIKGIQGRYWTAVLPLLACMALIRSQSKCRLADEAESPADKSAGTRDWGGTMIFASLLVLQLATVIVVAKYTISYY